MKLHFAVNGKRGFAWIMFLVIFFLSLSPLHGGTIYENFNNNTFNHNLFEIFTQGGPTVETINNSLVVTIPGESPGDRMDGYLVSNFRLTGDFDVQVDFNLLLWPLPNGVGTGIFMGSAAVDRRSYGPGNEVYEAYFAGMDFRVNTSDTSGKLRLKRTNETLEAFYWQNGWQSFGLHSDPQLAGKVHISIGAFSFANQFMGQTVEVALDNYQITNRYLGNNLAPITALLLD